MRSKGEGSIFRRKSDGLWTAQITVDGKRKTKHAKSQKEVRDWLHSQREAVTKGIYIDAKDMTLSAFLERYMASAAPSLKEKTVDGYNTLIRKHINPELGSFKLSKLRPDQVQAFYSQELEQGYSNRTIQYMHSVLHKALDQGVKWGLIARNVTDFVDPPTVRKSQLTTWTSKDAKVFLEHVKDTRTTR